MFKSKWSSTERLVAQEWLEKESRRSRLGRKCQWWPRCCYSRACVESMYIYNGALCIISLVLLIVLGTGIVAPFHKSLRFMKTNCTTVAMEYADKPRSCMCSSRHCRSSYPCVSLHAEFNTTEGGTGHSILHHSQYESGRCSYNPKCRRSKVKNKAAVAQFVKTFGDINTTYACLYDPHDVTRVILKRHGDHDRMNKLLVWPGVACVVFALGMLIPYMVCGCRFLWSRTPPQSIREEAEHRVRGISTSQYLQMNESVP